MSYDIEICKDRQYSEATNFQAAHACISQIPNITTNGSTGFCYEFEETHYMEIYLEEVTEDGEWTGNENPQQIQVIRCHIPYGHLNRTREHFNKYFSLCTTIADHLQWKSIDLQTGDYLIEVPT